MNNQEVVRIFREIAVILEFKGENIFRVRAYERAAGNIENLEDDLETIVNKEQVTSIPGVGVDLAGKIKEIVATGKLTYYENLKKNFPQGLLKMLDIPGLGQKTVKLIYERLKIDTVEKLEKYAKQGKLKGLEGIKEKTEENILRGIELLKKGRERVPISLALKISNDFIFSLKKIKAVEKVEIAGSLRRRKETIGDIDILVVSKNPSQIINKFVSLPQVEKIIIHGKSKASVISEGGRQVDLRVIEKKSFGAAMLYFTGSKEFNVSLRQLAAKKGYKLNEYGIFKRKKRVAGETEDEIFSFLNMAYIPPVLRENRGEIEAALKGKLPNLVQVNDIKGDLHIHSKYSDGFASLEDIAAYACKLGHEYIAVTDHSQSLKVARGLSEEALSKKIEEIKKLNKKFKKLKILTGAEVDILSDGTLDYPEKVLKKLDVVIAAVHTGFKQSKTQMTKRITSACRNKYVNFIAHPTGGLWGEREPYEIDFDEVFKAAGDNNVGLEINCHPQRLDLSDLNAMKARKRGVKLVISTDTHRIEQLNAVSLGVDVAQRAWLEKEDVINCMSFEKLVKWLEK